MTPDDKDIAEVARAFKEAGGTLEEWAELFAAAKSQSVQDRRRSFKSVEGGKVDE